MSTFNTFSSNVNKIKFGIIHTHSKIYKLEKKFNKDSGERWSPEEFINIWMDVSLRLILKDKSRNQHCFPFCYFVISNLGVVISLKKRVNRKRLRWSWGSRHLCKLVFQENFMQSLSTFSMPFCWKENSF